jgi:hypothetical protein
MCVNEQRRVFFPSSFGQRIFNEMLDIKTLIDIFGNEKIDKFSKLSKNGIIFDVMLLSINGQTIR